jgi:hypothetical protein
MDNFEARSNYSGKSDNSSGGSQGEKRRQKKEINPIIDF